MLAYYFDQVLKFATPIGLVVGVLGFILGGFAGAIWYLSSLDHQISAISKNLERERIISRDLAQIVTEMRIASKSGSLDVTDIRGPAGSTGLTGPKGNRGSAGATGLKGDRGLIGPEGKPGRDGAMVSLGELSGATVSVAAFDRLVIKAQESAAGIAVLEKRLSEMNSRFVASISTDRTVPTTPESMEKSVRHRTIKLSAGTGNTYLLNSRNRISFDGSGQCGRSYKFLIVFNGKKSCFEIGDSAKFKVGKLNYEAILDRMEKNKKVAVFSILPN